MRTDEAFQAEGRKIGARHVAEAWEHLSREQPDVEPTVFRQVHAAVQLVFAAFDKDDAQEAAAAAGSVVGWVIADTGREDLIAAVIAGIEGAVEASALMKGPVQ